MKRYPVVLLLLVILSSGSAAPQALGRATLKGLKQFDVVIESPGSEAERVGISGEQLKTDVELRLRKARLPVADSGVGAYLYVVVNPMQSDRGWIYSVSVGLFQEVTLERDKSISCLAETWYSASKVTITPPSEFVSHVRSDLGDRVDRFINDYLAANP